MLGAILGLGSSIFDGFMAGRKAKAQAKAEVFIAKGKAEAEVILTAAKSVDTWEQLQAKAAMDSWKDEAWTIFFIVVLGMSFLPWTQPYVKEGFLFLKNGVPDWFQWSFMASIAASFGIRGLAKFKG